MRLMLKLLVTFRKGKKKEKNDGTGDTTSTPTDDNSKSYLNQIFAQSSIKNSQLRQIIPLPAEIDLQEWLASHVIPFFQHVNLLYGTVSEFCTQSTCPVMSAPNNTIYFWLDDKGKKNKCSAVQYIDYVTASIEKLVRDDAVFPARHGLPFPANFELVVRRIQRQLFHILAHMYHAHFDAHVQLGTHLHLNGLLVHFTLFSQHFGLIEQRELDVLRDLLEILLVDAEVFKNFPTPVASAAVPAKDSTEEVVASEAVNPVILEEPVSVSPAPSTGEGDGSRILCDKKPVNPSRTLEVTAPLNVKNLLLGNPLESSVV